MEQDPSRPWAWSLVPPHSAAHTPTCESAAQYEIGFSISFDLTEL